jgi:hypothetical protein
MHNDEEKRYGKIRKETNEQKRKLKWLSCIHSVVGGKSMQVEPRICNNV